MNKNLILGGGAIGLGLFLAYKAKKSGKHVPLIGGFIPATPPAPAPTEKEAFSGAVGRSSGISRPTGWKWVHKGGDVWIRVKT